MIPVNKIIERKKAESFGLLSSSVSGHKRLGQPIEVVLDVLEKLIKEAPSSTVRQKLENERMDAIRRYNPSLNATIGRYQESLKVTDDIIRGTVRSTSEIIKKANINAEVMKTVYQGNTAYSKLYGEWAKNTEKYGNASEAAKRAFSVNVFTGRDSNVSLEQAIETQRTLLKKEKMAGNADIAKIQMYKANIALTKMQMETDRFITTTAEKAGVTDIVSLSKQLTQGAEKLKEFEDFVVSESKGAELTFEQKRELLKGKYSDVVLYGYERGKYKAAKKEYNIKIGLHGPGKKIHEKAIPTGLDEFLAQNDIVIKNMSTPRAMELEDLYLQVAGIEPMRYGEEGLIGVGGELTSLTKFKEVRERELYETTIRKDEDGAEWLKLRREAFEVEEKTKEQLLEEFADQINELTQGRVSHGKVYDLIDAVDEGKWGVISPMNISFDESIDPGAYGRQPFPTGKLSELNKYRLYLERLKQGGSRPLVNELIRITDRAIIEAGGNTREINILKKYGKATGMYQARTSLLNQMDASVLSAWQNVYGSLQLNTGFGSSVPQSMQGGFIRMTGLSPVYKNVWTSGIDEVTGKYFGKDFQRTERILERMDVKVESLISKNMLQQSTEGLSLAPHLGRSQMLKVASEIAKAEPEDINYDNVFRAFRGSVDDKTADYLIGQNRLAREIQEKFLLTPGTTKYFTDVLKDVLGKSAPQIARTFRDPSSMMPDAMAQIEEMQELLFRVFPQLSQSVTTSISSAASREAAEILGNRTAFTMATPNIKLPKLSPISAQWSLGSNEEDFYNYINKEIEETLRPAFRLNEQQELIYSKYSKHASKVQSKLSGFFFEATPFATKYTDQKAITSSTKELFNDMTRYMIANILQANEDIAGPLSLDNQAPSKTILEFQRVLYKTMTETKGVSDYFRLMSGDEVGSVLQQIFSGKAIAIDDNSELIDILFGHDVTGATRSASGGRRTITDLSDGLDAARSEFGEVNEEIKAKMNALFREAGFDRKIMQDFQQDALDNFTVIDNNKIMEIIETGREGNMSLEKTIKQIELAYTENAGDAIRSKIVQEEANNLLQIKDVRRFSFGVVDTDMGSMVEITGYNDVLQKDMRWAFLNTPDEVKLVFDKGYFQKRDVRMKDLIYHGRTNTDRVNEVLTQGAMERYGDEIGIKVPEIARDYLGMDINVYDKTTKDVARTMTHTEIIDAIARTNDLPIHMFEGGVQRGELANAMSGIEDLSFDKTLLRTPELFWMAMQEEALTTGSDSVRMAELLREIEGTKPPIEEQTEELIKTIQDRFKSKVRGSGAGVLVENLIRDEIQAPRLLASRLPSAVTHTIDLAEKTLKEIKSGEFLTGPRWTKNVALATIALLGASAIYKTAKDIIGTDSGNGPETRMAMNDEGYGNSATPVRYENQSGGINTSGSNPFAGLSSLRLSDNMNDINDIELDRMMSEM